MIDRVTFVTLLAFAVGCGRHEEFAETPPATQAPIEATLHPVPELPPDVLVQETFRGTGRVYAVTTDGRWLVTEPGGLPVERAALPRDDEPGRVPEEALRKLKALLVGLEALPASIPSGVPGDTIVPPGSPIALTPIAFSFRGSDGAVHVVEVAADPRTAASFGAMQALAEILGQQVYGSWRDE